MPDDDRNSDPRETPRSGWDRWVRLTVAIGVICLLVLLLLPVNGPTQVELRRSSSKSNLRMLVIAAHNYHVAHGTFPPGQAEGAPKHAGHGWAIAILPQMDMKAIYDSIDFDKPWDDPAHVTVFSAEIPGYTNPAVPEMKDARGYGLIHYAGNVRLLGRDPSLAPEDVTDGLGNTLLFGEVNAGYRPWGRPRNLRDPALGLNRGPATFGSVWKEEWVQFAAADHSVHVIAGDTAPRILKALATPDGGEPVDFPDD
ncbi:MAG: DUF1559 domain-containing protein [Planctomycetales bacterium]